MVGPQQDVAIVCFRDADVLLQFLLIARAEFQDRELHALSLPLMAFDSIAIQRGSDALPPVLWKLLPDRSKNGRHALFRCPRYATIMPMTGISTSMSNL